MPVASHEPEAPPRSVAKPVTVSSMGSENSTLYVPALIATPVAACAGLVETMFGAVTSMTVTTIVAVPLFSARSTTVSVTVYAPGVQNENVGAMPVSVTSEPL